MKKEIKEKVCKEIYRKHPDMKDVRPVIKAYKDDQKLLIFNSKAKTANGFSLPKTLRVVVNQDGKIIKKTTSR